MGIEHSARLSVQSQLRTSCLIRRPLGLARNVLQDGGLESMSRQLSAYRESGTPESDLCKFTTYPRRSVEAMRPALARSSRSARCGSCCERRAATKPLRANRAPLVTGMRRFNLTIELSPIRIRECRCFVYEYAKSFPP